MTKENIPTVNDDFTPRRPAALKRKSEQAPPLQQEQHTSPLDAAIIETLKSSKSDDTNKPKEKDTDTMFCFSLDTMKTMFLCQRSVSSFSIFNFMLTS